ncbi:MAG TPA: hypothetical protein VJB57_19970 [Dehalococcoidia bacterium]|nr:hypothetical protein [Dehalococcoidia bacterium]
MREIIETGLSAATQQDSMWPDSDNEKTEQAMREAYASYPNLAAPESGIPTRSSAAYLAPFGVIAVILYVAIMISTGAAHLIAVGAAVVVVTAILWFGVRTLRRQRQRRYRLVHGFMLPDDVELSDAAQSKAPKTPLEAGQTQQRVEPSKRRGWDG